MRTHVVRNWWWMIGLLGALVLLASPQDSHAQARATGTLDSILVVPNPYSVSGRTHGPISNLKAYERIIFTNLPDPATIRIYTSAGNHVATIEHKGSRQYEWSGRNADNQYIVSDVYIYVVQAPGLGVKVGKFIVVK